MRYQITKKLRFEILKRDDFRCRYCGQRAPNVVLQVDHLYPVSMGGNNRPENLITSCQACNQGKGDSVISFPIDVDKNDVRIFMVMDWVFKT